jgi:hypothetical protein
MTAQISSTPPEWLSPDDCIGAVIGPAHVAVSIRIEREPITQRTRYRVAARVVDPETGASVMGRDGQPIQSAFAHSATHDAIASTGELVMLRELARVVLGLPPGLDADGAPLLPVSDDVRRDADIHTALAADARTGTVPPALAALM